MSGFASARACESLPANAPAHPAAAAGTHLGTNARAYPSAEVRMSLAFEAPVQLAAARRGTLADPSLPMARRAASGRRGAVRGVRTMRGRPFAAGRRKNRDATPTRLASRKCVGARMDTLMLSTQQAAVALDAALGPAAPAYRSIGRALSLGRCPAEAVAAHLFASSTAADAPRLSRLRQPDGLASSLQTLPDPRSDRCVGPVSRSRLECASMAFRAQNIAEVR